VCASDDIKKENCTNFEYIEADEIRGIKTMPAMPDPVDVVENI
jgi:hypothetical protein